MNRLKKKMKKQIQKTPLQMTRRAVQLAFIIFLLFVGWQFYQFYLHFHTLGEEPFVERPAAVEGFLPISALLAFRVWITTWHFDYIHPAGFVLFLFFIASGIFFRKTFCSWMCPVGTISEWMSNLGKKLFKRQFEPPKWLRYILRSIKYLLLIWFVKMVIEMPLVGAIAFMNSDYNKIADVHMLMFFIDVSVLALTVVLVLFVLSLFIKNFWCRFLCPYGALIGLGGLFGVTAITRNEETCIDCKQCTKVCPVAIEVSEKSQVRSPDCSACMHCVEVCPKKDTLYMSSAGFKLNKWIVPTVFFVLFFGTVVIAQLTGNWNTSITYEQYQNLIYFMD
ncbi:4Fe-4S binding protein [Texcoconibacillus texcoconensis]|uniref:Polyferredoxin n=1 Tax=Texcoconibacillus texcoconensis TaxID=1095777 RepID=A0A840QU39_9BACI|nr:4Fe-4S binding protein [Texcoconibacillus texcoconensis]MBB5174808.1 polyferredoxin [Texcoconibacillus texcoconensis]